MKTTTLALMFVSSWCSSADIISLQTFSPMPTATVEYMCEIGLDFTVKNSFIGQYNFSDSNIYIQQDFLTAGVEAANQSTIATYNYVFKFEPAYYISIGAGGQYMHRRYDDYASDTSPVFNTRMGAATINYQEINVFGTINATYVGNSSYSVDVSYGVQTYRQWFMGFVNRFNRVDVDSPVYYEQEYRDKQMGAQLAYVGSRMNWSIMLTNQAFTWDLGVSF